MLPPSEDRSTWYIEIEIPDEAEIKILAERLHAAGRDWQGEIGGWPARYTARRAGLETVRLGELDGDGYREWTEERPYDRAAELTIGWNYWPWRYWIRWEAQGTRSGQHPEQIEVVA
jgi:hypothetical protein